MARYIVQMRRGTSTQWSNSDIIPLPGELVVEIDEENNLHKLKIGDGVHAYTDLAYLMAGDEIVTQILAQTKPRVVTVELTTNWTPSDDDKYSQIVAIDGITKYSRLDLQPSADMLAEFKQLGLVFVTENNAGVITAYSVGNMPQKAYIMQATIVETECDGQGMSVVSAPIGIPVAQSDWTQTDSTKSDYIKNKPNIPTNVSAFTNDAGYLTEHQSLDGLATEDYVNTQIATIPIPSDEIYVGDGDMPQDATIQIIMDAVDEEQALENTLKDYIHKELAGQITQEAGQSESLVMSQKAVTDLVTEALESGGGGTSIEYETVDGVDEMTDTSKQYVLKETGTIWTYGEVSGDVNEQIFDASRTFQGHMSGVNIVSNGSYNIYVMPVDVSQIPSGADVWIEVKGFYVRNTTSPFIEKVGYSVLENPIKGNSQIITSSYADSSNFGGSIQNVSGGCKIHVGYIKEAKVDNYDTIKTVLLEIPTAQTHDASTITAYLQYSGTVTKWYDTGLTPSATGGGGGNYVELLVKVNKNTSDIYEVSERLTALETGSDSVTIPSFWQSAVDACITKIKALQVGRNCVTFPFFSDNHQRNGYTGMLIAHIMKECHIPYCFYGGDSISSGTIVDEAEMIAQDKAFDTMMSYVPNGRMCRAVGNHDGYWYDGTNKYYYNRDQIYDLFLREESIAQNKHFGDDGTYYFVDEISSKTRFIVMNTNGGSVDSTQISWVQNMALSFAESGWSVVFISHQPICNAYHSGVTNAANVVSAVTSTAAANNISIIGWFSGHVHRDRIYTKLLTGGNGSNPGTETSELGFTQVIITSDHTGIAYNNDDGTVSDTKHTVASDDQSHAIDFVTINKATRTVNITRLGIGNDRSYTY